MLDTLSLIVTRLVVDGLIFELMIEGDIFSLLLNVQNDSGPTHIPVNFLLVPGFDVKN